MYKWILVQLLEQLLFYAFYLLSVFKDFFIISDKFCRSDFRHNLKNDAHLNFKWNFEFLDTIWTYLMEASRAKDKPGSVEPKIERKQKRAFSSFIKTEIRN